MQPQRWVKVLLLALTAASEGFAQDSSRERIYFSALNREEKPKLGLTANDFRFQINGRPATMEEFHPGLSHTDRSRPIVAWILLDFSPEVDARMISDQAAAAAGMLDLLHPDSAVGVQLISDRAEILAPLGYDREALRKAFLRFTDSRMELKARSQRETVYVGREGILGAMDLAVTDLNNFALAEPSLKDRETLRAVIVISPANLNPAYDTRPLVEKAARHRVFLYPIFVPVVVLGPWVQYYFDLAKQTGGVASTFGAISPASTVFKLQRPSLEPNALKFNFIHVVRDLNGKYSFAAPPVPPGSKLELKLKCLRKDVWIRLPRKHLP